MSDRRRFYPVSPPVQKGINIPPDLANHYAFRGYNSGCCGRLVGNLAIVSIFVSDPKSKWNAYEMAKYKQEVTAAGNFLLANGGRAAGLRIAEKVFLQASIPYEEKRDEYTKTATDALRNLGYTSFESFRSAIMQQYNGVSTVAVFFVLNKDERSFALSLKGHKSMRSTRRSDISAGEYSVIYAKSHGRISYTICHELLHLYGAIDYYYPESTRQISFLFWPHSIMLCNYESPLVDDLTRYLVGWESSLNNKSSEYLRKIAVACKQG